MEFTSFLILMLYASVWVACVVCAFMIFVSVCGIANYLWNVILELGEGVEPELQEQPPQPPPQDVGGEAVMRTFYRAPQEGPFVPESTASMQRRYEALRHCAFAANEFAL